ncbi:hypothetical protein NHJ13051_001152 [Beauveria bassiana]
MPSYGNHRIRENVTLGVGVGVGVGVGGALALRAQPGNDGGRRRGCRLPYLGDHAQLLSRVVDAAVVLCLRSHASSGSLVEAFNNAPQIYYHQTVFQYVFEICQVSIGR